MIHDRSRAHPPGSPGAKLTIAIVGGGFSGSMTAANLLRIIQVPVHILLIERAGVLGPGLAYGTGRSTDLLNVPAAGMSAWPDEPEHFLQWCRARLPQVSSRSFLPRHLYGEYVREVLDDARSMAAPGVELIPVMDQAIAIRPLGARLQIDFRIGLSRSVDVAVLALGNGEAAIPDLVPEDLRASDRFVANPWLGDSLAAIAPDEQVLILGTGLTMVDIALALHAQGHRAPLVAVSRHGLTPQAHRIDEQPAADRELPPTLRGHARSARALLAAMRHELRRASEEGVDWRLVVDSLRPHAPAIWAALDTRQRRSFLRHLRAYWDCHRHRCGPAVADRLGAFRARGFLQVQAARITALRLTPVGVLVDLRPRGAAGTTRILVDRIINGTGVETDFRRRRDPLVRQLVADGLVLPTDLGLGLGSSPHGAALDAWGRASRRLFLIGSCRKASLWESTAIPELRMQARALASHLDRWIERQTRHRPSGTWSARPNGPGTTA